MIAFGIPGIIYKIVTAHVDSIPMVLFVYIFATVVPIRNLALVVTVALAILLLREGLSLTKVIGITICSSSIDSIVHRRLR